MGGRGRGRTHWTSSVCHVPCAICHVFGLPGTGVDTFTTSTHRHIHKDIRVRPRIWLCPSSSIHSHLENRLAPRSTLLVSVCLIQIFNIFYVCCRSLSRISCHLHRHPHEHIDPHLHLHLHIHCHWHWIGNGNCSRKTLATWPATDLTNLPPLRFRVERIRTSHSGASPHGITDRGDPNRIELQSSYMNPYTTFGMG